MFPYSVFSLYLIGFFYFRHDPQFLFLFTAGTLLFLEVAIVEDFIFEV